MWNTEPNHLKSLFDRQSVADIAARFEVSVTAARNHLTSLGLVRSISEANRIRYRKHVVYLSPEQEQIVYGSLLGDACLYRQEKPTHFTLKVWFAHGEDQLGYLRHKRKITGGCKISQRPEGSNFGKPTYQFAYSNTQGLLPIERIVMRDGTKTVNSDWLAKLDWQGIAIWYQDDASLILQRGKISCIRWYTNSFSRAEVDLLCDLLRTKGLASISISRGNCETEPVIVAYRANDITAFVDRLKPYKCKCLNYKFRV